VYGELGRGVSGEGSEWGGEGVGREEDFLTYVCVCVCVSVREREREREEDVFTQSISWHDPLA